MATNPNTVTAPNPTPPTNFSCTGATPPNPPNLTKNTYADYLPDTDFDTAPPPYFDDGSAGSGIVFAANTAALASGSADTAGGTGNPTGSTAGTAGTYPGVANGTVPASTSVAHEGAGTETVATAGTGSWLQGANVYNPAGPLQMVGAGNAWSANPNQNHNSTLSPANSAVLSTISPTTAVSGASGTDTVTFTGTDFTKQSVVWVQHGTLPPVRVATTFVSPSGLTAPVPKRTSAGTSTVYVVTGGVISTVTKTITYS